LFLAAEINFARNSFSFISNNNIDGGGRFRVTGTSLWLFSSKSFAFRRGREKRAL
jgi:hypothetical protein